MFNGEVKSSEEVEAWILVMKKYFKVHDHFRKMKARVDV